MAIYLGITWKCETCRAVSHGDKPWPCPACGKETCEQCFDRFGICNSCSEGESDEELKKISERHYGGKKEK